MKERRCIGYGETEGVCTNVAGTPWTPLWCPACDEKRRAAIDKSLREIEQRFAAAHAARQGRP